MSVSRTPFRKVKIENNMNCLQSTQAFIMDIDSIPYQKVRKFWINSCRWDNILKHFIIRDSDNKMVIVDPFNTIDYIRETYMKNVSKIYDFHLEDGSTISDVGYFFKLKGLVQKAVVWRIHQLPIVKNKPFLVHSYLLNTMKLFDEYVLKTRNVVIPDKYVPTLKDQQFLELLEQRLAR